MKAPDSVIGKTVKCPACQTQFAVTGSPPPLEPEPAAPRYVDEEAEPPRRARPSGQASAFVEFLLFRRMIAPFIIQLIFWIGTVLMFFGGLIIAGISLIRIGDQAAAAILGTLSGLAYMVFGPIALRVYCEILIVFFRMYETMREVRDGIDRMRKD
jgi:hypothetical protein